MEIIPLINKISFLGMLISFISASVINGFFTIRWIEKNGDKKSPDFYTNPFPLLAPLSNHLKAIHLASKLKTMPVTLRVQQVLYIISGVCLLTFIGIAILRY
jgi:hypothetical protein